MKHTLITLAGIVLLSGNALASDNVEHQCLLEINKQVNLNNYSYVQKSITAEPKLNSGKVYAECVSKGTLTDGKINKDYVFRVLLGSDKSIVRGEYANG